MSKKQQLIKMLGGRAGVDVMTISRKLGWQAHTTRAAMTGLRKCGYQLTATKSATGKPARYRNIATPTDGANSTAQAVENAG